MISHFFKIRVGGWGGEVSGLRILNFTLAAEMEN